MYWRNSEFNLSKVKKDCIECHQNFMRTMLQKERKKVNEVSLYIIF